MLQKTAEEAGQSIALGAIGHEALDRLGHRHELGRAHQGILLDMTVGAAGSTRLRRRARWPAR